MSTPELVKLTSEGQSLSLRVTSCGPMKVGTYPEISFIGTNDNGRLLELRVPAKSADRQLARIPLSYQEAVGCDLTFSRDPNATDASKPYWGISLSRPSRAVAPPTGSQVHRQEAGPGLEAVRAPAGQPAGKAWILDPAYVEITKAVLAEIVPLYEAKDIGLTDVGIGAMVATAYIQFNRGNGR